MSIRRTATAFGAISLGLITLSACDKPTPAATVTVGSKSVQAEATKACRESGGKKLPEDVFVSCLQTAPKHHITVNVGDKVRVGVDPSIAKKGWLIAADTTLVTNEPLKDKTYWSLDSDQLFERSDPQTGGTSIAKTVTLNIVESSDTSGQESYRVIQVKLIRGK